MPSLVGNEREPTKDELAHAGKLVRGILSAAVVLADGLIRRFGKRELRRPTADHLDDFSDPVGQILARHADLSVLGPDLIDVTTAAAAVGNYLIDGPITSPRATESAVPSWRDGEDTPTTESPTESPDVSRLFPDHKSRTEPVLPPVVNPTQVSYLS